MATRRSALPARRARLIGRQRELDDLRDRILHGDRRLVTLTGAGGSGKTTLAIETCRLVEPAVPDGAWFVDLSIIRDVDEATLSLCDAFGIVDQGRPPLDALADHLAVRQALVLLDNCEHLLPAFAETVDTLLDRCPDLRIFATSRVPLRISGESVFVVPPFAAPGVGIDVKDLGLLSSIPAVELFVERASAANPSFVMSSSTAPAVASICRRLDGLPLAIELAAAQTAVLTPVEIDERLGSTGGLGPSSSRATARQRTMEATLDWSHDLLRPAEQAVFRRMAVFVGGWTLEAAEQVCSLDEDPSSVVASLATLVEHSLVVRDGQAARSRYRMLVPIAEYARRRLATSGEAPTAGMSHALYYFALTTRDHQVLGENAPEDLVVTTAEHENCLAAIRFAEEAGMMPLRLGLIRNLLLLWRVRGYIRLGTRHMEAALETVADGSYEQGMLLGVLADYQTVLGEYDVAERRARDAEAIFESLGDPIARRTAMGELGMIAAARGDLAGAMAEYDRAKPLIDALPSDGARAYWHAGVGQIELGLGDLEAAERDLELARDNFSRAPAWTLGQVLAQLGVIARRNGDPARAEGLLGDALRVLGAYGATVEAIACLEEVARVAVEKREWRRAATVFAATTGLRDATAAAANPSDRAQLDSDIDHVRSMLDARAFDAAWLHGLGLTLDEAAEVAMGVSDVVAVAKPVPRGSLLTPREREIADLVALGLTNREIAERLVISTGTVRIHVERILGKLGRTSRVQVATWVVDQRGRDVAVEAPSV